MTHYQMIPYNRIVEHFLDQMQIPVSAVSIVNFNKEAYERLEFFDNWLKEQLVFSALVHVNKTGINTGGNRSWLNNASNDRCSYFNYHAKRGCAGRDGDFAKLPGHPL